MNRTEEILTFRIKGARFDRMPMERVAEYMRNLSDLFGKDKTRVIRLGKTFIEFAVKGGPT